jgi:hypothetical protein
MKKIVVPGVLLGVVLCLSLEAVVPQKWTLRSKEDFLQGKFDGVSLSFEGALSLAPREDRIVGPTEEFYLSLLPLADGSLFLGTGHGGKIYQIDKDGKADLYFQTQEMDVTCLVRDSKGVLFAGTSPNGKIYRIKDKGKGEEFFNPAEKYVWDLMFTESGALLAAVGESGGIYEVNVQGEGRQVLKTEENHILRLTKGLQGDVIAGSGGGGMVYRLSREGRASVLFESPYEEVRGLVLDKDGNIYACASGTPTKTRKDESAAPGAKPADVVLTVSASSGSAADSSSSPSSGTREPSALYRITPDGVARMLWSSGDEMIYSLAWMEAGKSVLFGTGGKGRIYSVNREERTSLVLQESSEQAYLLVPFESKTYIVANNPCYLGVLSPEQRFSGEYLSPTLDTKTVSSWGKIEWTAELGTGTILQVLTRSGNSGEPNQTWSDWSPPCQKPGEQVLSPKARFLQFKALFRTASGKSSPSLQKTEVFYLQTNIAPSVSGLVLLKPNEVLIKLPEEDDVIWGIGGNPPDKAPKKDPSPNLLSSKKVERKGFQTLIWEASDENGDALSYVISIRMEGEAEWRVLQPKWEESIFAFDTLSFPDGTYFLKVAASDTPSNPQGTELKGERTSSPLVIDNSLPVIKSFSTDRTGAGLGLTFQAEDSYSNIEEVKYLVRPDEWHVVFPVDGICDSQAENFKFTVKLPAGAENMITIRVKDSYGNIGVYKQTY